MSGSDRVGMPEAVGAASRRAVDNRVRTCRDAEVVRVLGDGERVEVRLLVGEFKDVGAGQRESMALPVTPPVPVRYPRTSSVAIVTPPAVGDVGVLHFRDVSHASSDAGESRAGDAPSSARRWNPADAYWTPNDGAPSRPMPSGSLRVDAAPVVDMADGISLHVGGGAASIEVAKAPETDANFTEIAAILGDLVAAWNLAAAAGGPLIVGKGDVLVPFTRADVGTSRIKVDE